MKRAQSHFHDVRGLRYHVRRWGDPGRPKLVLLHGWMDVSASFQFLVDSFQNEWHVIAPDLRGFGLTEWAPAGYWFPDYYADLEALLDIYQPDAPVNLAGHSMGGNIACAYAGIRPWRADTPQQFARRQGAFRDFREVTIGDCGHMMHHDQPRELARIIEDFLSETRGIG
jgi:pimeloyl-ACP methyl ester carboxylesterase